MKHIVILGGGFAGVAAALQIRKALSHQQAKITLIDQNPYHVFTPSLYEVATSEEPKGNIAIPFKEIFDGDVDYIQRKVEKINADKSVVVLTKTKDKSSENNISYDYLVIALGSQPSYFHLPGLKENSMTLKSIDEAIKIKNKILTRCCKDGECNRKTQVVIGGGGFSGTELAAELLTYKSKIAKQHHLDPDCLEITIIQGSDRLLKELDEHVGKIAESRIRGKHVKFAFGGHISKVTNISVFTDDNKVFNYDILIWTGGVEANSILGESGLPVNKRGQALVNKYLQLQGYENIFAAGDNVEFIYEKTKTPAPTVAQVAEEEGKAAGENIARLIGTQTLKPYKYRHFGYIVPLKGRYAVAELMGLFHFDGLIGWVLQQFVFLRYLLSILPLTKAVKDWDKFELALEQ